MICRIADVKCRDGPVLTKEVLQRPNTSYLKLILLLEFLRNIQ